MLRFSAKHRKKIAAFLLMTFLFELVSPNVARALTSGPMQPEMKSFEPVGTSDMVDLFTGDFSYNIPLLDVGGYPVNLSYHSGSGMDDEASWVGYGWTLNPGAVNRQMRGLPDDFNGSDEMVEEKNMKDHITKGISVRVKADILGIPGKGKLKGKKLKKAKALKVSPSISLGVKYDNYRGIGTSIGLNAGLEIGEAVAGEKTKDLNNANPNKPGDSTSYVPHAGANFGLNLSSMDGASVNLNFDIIKNATEKSNYSLSSSIGFPYNSRAGLQEMTLGASFSNRQSKDDKLFLKNTTSSHVSFVGNTYTPTVDFPTKNTAYTVDISGGGQLQIFYLGGGITGFYTKQQYAYNKINKPGYGFLYSELGKDNGDGLMDINREKDIPYNKKLSYIPVPIPTNDLFSVSSQAGGGQYRVYRGSSGVFFDAKTEGISNDVSLGIELGFGSYFDIGGDFHYQKTKTTTKKWTSKNAFLNVGDYRSSSSLLHEKAYFKRVGEPVLADIDLQAKENFMAPVAAKLMDNQRGKNLDGAAITSSLRTNDKIYAPGQLVKQARDVRNNSFSYLTAKEASFHGFSKTIQSYPLNTIVLSDCINAWSITNIARVDGAFANGIGAFSRTKSKRPHHISEVTVTTEDGKRMIYGIPVYNKYQEEVSFSIGEDLTKRNRGIIAYNHSVTIGDNSSKNSKGRDNYFSKQKMPGYATSYLLTEIVSPDYVDVKGDGVTDDDRGTAVKINYTKLAQDYKWRSPYDSANYNEGFLSDNKDDKANYVYGEKEIWYMHSIESKTMLALFVLQDRDDGLGVLNDAGGKNTDMRLKLLKEIRLYSKSDLIENKNDLSQVTPIKTVHFDYDYSIQNNLPNNATGAGKLTLKKVYFTFGANSKGALNPYQFEYNIDPQYNNYDMREYDRWGNFKNAASNPGGLNNSEYSYTLQDKNTTDVFVSLWQLKKITLPSGGQIKISYESDDYAYVQDKRASEMCFLSGVGSNGSSSGLITADEVFVRLPQPLSSFGNFSSDAERKRALAYRYFNNLNYLYFKMFIDLDNKGHKEFVPGYAKILDYRYIDDTTVAIKLEKWGDEKKRATNPIAFSAWQFMRNCLPKLAYPGYENMDDEGNVSFKQAVQSLLTALGSIKELTQGFSGIARRNSYCNNVDLQKSWVRLYAPDFKKLGGGSRVKTLAISDAWADMVGSQNGKTTEYTMDYSYTTTASDESGKQTEISSGVASYEPLIGSDENPFHQPVFYEQKVPLFLTDHSYLEEPFGESFYPSPVVGYSKVTVKNIGAGQTLTSTGTVENEFYTAKDYPTQVKILTLEKKPPGFEKILKMLRVSIRDLIGLSQGYSIVNNDMHGKPKATTVKNLGGSEISKQEYFYKNENELSETKNLSNQVKLIYPDGIQRDGIIGQDVEMFTDMREQTTENYGLRIQASGGSGAIAFWPVPFGFPGVGPNNEYRSYRASSTIKLVNQFSLLQKVIKTVNGSSIATENLAWDPITGEVLLTKTQNEFDDPVYSFTYPAHWVYNGMGQAYRNAGTYLSGFSTDAQGVITNGAYTSATEKVLLPGDELIDLNSTKKYWIVYTQNSYRLIDEDGVLQTVTNLAVKVLRSGRRNMPDAAVASITSLENPIVNGKVDISSLTKVLDAKAVVFKDEWCVPFYSGSYVDPSEESCIDPSSLATLFEASTSTQIPELSKKNLFVSQGDQQTAGSIMNSYVEQGGSLYDSTRRYNFWNGMPANSFEFYLHKQRMVTLGCTKVNQILPNDTASLGNCQLVFDYVNNSNQGITEYNNSIRLKPFGYNAPIFNCGGDEYRFSNTGCSFTISKVKVVSGNGSPHDSVLYDLFRMHLVCGPWTTNGCLTGGAFNPYFTGALGNWRAQSSRVFQTDREHLTGSPAVQGSTNIRKAGAYSLFTAFWVYDNTSNSWKQTTNTSRWIAPSEVTQFNMKGVEVENKDALNRYSGALYGYLESLPVAVASNSKANEIAYDGFEDYAFDLQCNYYAANCDSLTGPFNFKNLLNSSIVRTNDEAHTGKYSLKVSGSNGVVITRSVTDPLQGSYPFFSVSSLGRYLLNPAGSVKRFSPIAGKKYIFSCWVKDGIENSVSTNARVAINGNNNYVTGSNKWPMVEGWKRIEFPFIMPTSQLRLQLTGGGTIYFDDIRIHPFDGQLKSFAYDASSQRLMAEMDENNMATLYEYDDEGILVRVKKETERGIMTIKETRSSLGKRN